MTATHLKTGHTTSCGCSKISQYERRIQAWLDEHNFSYIREKKYPELGKLRFDFLVYRDDEEILIEMQGQQHYRPSSLFGGEKAYERLTKHDQDKVHFCKANDIPLLVIKYDENIEEILSEFLL